MYQERKPKEKIEKQKSKVNGFSMEETKVNTKKRAGE